MTQLSDMQKSENIHLFVFNRPKAKLGIARRRDFNFVTLLFESIEAFVMQILRKVNDFGQCVCVFECKHVESQTQTS